MRAAAADPAIAAPPPTDREPDQRVFLRGLSWEQYEALLAMRGEAAVPRITYLEGTVELMSSSRDHEVIKKFLARLLEAWAEERGLDLNGYGSWTIKRPDAERGAEADECYTLGDHAQKERPDLALEVVWTSGGLDKLEVWRRLGVPEVWFWEDGAIGVWCLEGERYVARERSALLPDVDLALLARLATLPSQLEALRALRAALRGE